MLKTIIKKNHYQDSVNLMLLTNKINEIEGVEKCSIMMGTQANIEILKNTEFLTEEACSASPSDMVIVMGAKDRQAYLLASEMIDQFLVDLTSPNKKKNDAFKVHSMQAALEQNPDSNLALFSIPGEYAADEIENALNNNLHVFSFSDNVSLNDEVRLKNLAHKRGLIMMGPDCGTGILSGIPLAFTNIVRPGNIGIVAASGTGLQEVSSLIDRWGGGVLHAIGTGGRDLNEKVNGVTTKDALIALEHLETVDVIVLISKPPADSVREDILNLLLSLTKPVVAIFLGDNPDHHEGNIFLAHTLEEAARIAVDLSKGFPVCERYEDSPENTVLDTLSESAVVKGVYSGGTLGTEAAMLISEALNLSLNHHKGGYLLDENGYQIIDFGDDIYTQGRAHPMINPQTRIAAIKEFASDPKTGVVLFDVVLGYGSHPDMAGVLAPVIQEALDLSKKEKHQLFFIASVCGTSRDSQGYERSVNILREAGVLVERSNAKAVRLALQLKGFAIKETDKRTISSKHQKIGLPKPSEKVMELLSNKPRVINVGLKSFNESIRDFGGQVVQYSWKPIAGGDRQLIRIVKKVSAMESISIANHRVVDRMKEAQLFLVDVLPAKSAIPILEEKTLLHAGTVIDYGDMTGPMQGSCVGAAIFEGWADNEKEARKLLESGEVNFVPCHDVHAVGPMGGITSGNMYVLVVKNQIDGTVAYCTMNEGIGKVLRFGAFSNEVIERLHWMSEVLGPTIAKAVSVLPEGLNLNTIIAKAITMGDEFHQRNIASSLLLLKELIPLINAVKIDQVRKSSVLQFLAETDQFFLNVMMACGKAIVDYARKIDEGTIVTAMTRNGRDFGIRIAGMGDEWFTAPVNTPRGLYFAGYTEGDANPDIGDSAITETIGVGALATIAAPAVTRFVGSGGGYNDALRITEEMDQICFANNPNWNIPNWNFRGSCLGVDAIKIVSTGITPLINTGIAHQVAGEGQIGAGTVRAPFACFEKAIIAYARKLKIDFE